MPTTTLMRDAYPLKMLAFVFRNMCLCGTGQDRQKRKKSVANEFMSETCAKEGKKTVKGHENASRHQTKW